MEVRDEIGLAIEHSIAASRWRIAARFEGPETAAQFRRLADSRSEAATSYLEEFATVGRGEPADRHSTHRAARGAGQTQA